MQCHFRQSINQRYFRTHKVVKKIKIPAQIVTAVTFCGPNLDILCVTTASKALDINTGELFSRTFDGGLVYKVMGLGAVGRPDNKVSV